MAEWISLAVSFAWGLAGVIFLAGKFFGKSDGQAQRLIDLKDHIDHRCDAIKDQNEAQLDEMNERFDKVERDTEIWTKELRNRTHSLSSEMNALPVKLAQYFMPREVSVTIQQESVSDRARLWVEMTAVKAGVEALWKELRSRLGRSRGAD